MSEPEMIERVAKAICKAKGQQPNLCVMGTAGVSYQTDGSTIYHADCSRYAWQDWTGAARAAIAAMQPAQILQPEGLGMGCYCEMMMGEGKR